MLVILTLLLALPWVLESFLTWRNVRFYEHSASQLPSHLRGRFSPEFLNRSAAYTRDKSYLGLLSDFWGLVLVLAAVLLGFFGSVEQFVYRFGFGSYLTGIVFLLSLSFLSTLLQLPFAWYRTFVVEERYGFNKQSFRGWCADLVKSLLLSSCIGSILLVGIFWFMDTAGGAWWLWAAAFVVLFQLVLVFLYPTLIAPLFNSFTPLPDGDLKRELETLAVRVDFPNRGIFVMDGSKRSGHGNAYFAGFGAGRRIVLFDTLIEQLSVSQIGAVLAHEIGHAKLGHIPRLLLWSTLWLFIGFWALSLIASNRELFELFALQFPSNHGALLIFSIIAAPAALLITPLTALLSRRYEYQADSYAKQQVGSPEPLAEALVRLSTKSLSNINPHPWYSFFHYSHPTLGERLRALMNLISERVNRLV